MRGSLIAAFLLTLLPEKLRFLSNYRMLIYSIVLIAMMLFNWAPGSIAFRKRLTEKLKGNKKTTDAALKATDTKEEA